MRHYEFCIPVLLIIFVSMIGCTTTDLDISLESENDSTIRIYEVFGMDCPGCHGALEKLLVKIPGIQQAQANWVEKQVVIRVKPDLELNDEDVYEAIKQANFTVGNRIR